MQYLPRVPDSPPLAGLVEIVFFLDGYRPGHVRERLVPNGRMNLVFALDGRDRFVFDNETGEALQVCRHAWLSGVHTNHVTIGETQPDNRLLVVQFAPGGSAPFTHCSAERFCDRIIPAEEVFGTDVLELRDRLVASEQPPSALDLTEEWLASRFDSSQVPPREIAHVLSALIQDPGEMRLTDFVERETTISYKHFVHLFRHHVGPTAKSLQRILRFESIFTSIQAEQSVDWAALSVRLGYSDQAHLIRDFRAFSGYRPATFHAEGHDRVNFFPNDDSPDDHAE